MSSEKWKELYKKIERLEDKILKAREEWVKEEKGSSFSYYLYEKKVEDYRNRWNELVALGEDKSESRFQEEVPELATVRLEKIRIQAMINRDDFPENEEVKEQAEAIIREAGCLLADCNNW